MKISLIVPVYNEEETIEIFYKAVRNNKFLSEIDVEIIFVDDGSKDRTFEIINELEKNDNFVKSLRLSRNFGKEAALTAGIDISSGDAVIPIDVDLQHPIEVIPELVRKWQDGADVVLAKSTARYTDGFLKRITTEWFYSFHNKISKPSIEENAGDFRLMSREVINNLKLLPEKNRFMKGLFAWVGGDIEIVEYTQSVRSAGTSKFNGWKLWNLALEGITSFSTVPLRIWTYVGIIIAGLSFAYGAWMIVDTIFFGNRVRGYPSLLVSVLFLGGVQLIGIGVLGEYIGRIYIEVKQRPLYLLKKGNSKKDV
ncbi:glycosyltransferase family 2 protein [Yersinia kristensenii]|uniref:glycosyltransferase family 2 protein n=1 Tax=Yersinia kristensenii TaxID=28152 RepID=UPI0005E920E5|nr:glycosyltransferase family 2 protein [Yersinia kristensenii]CNG29788.1 undecaprenyl phosphate 4-deoxy-4-formamido-L-arabinose transferase [Yersinia kristensenii]CNJ67314.1 undecaprenyl phosphate 4-deoxy-4-formamido-L-arabinose transferase [Yersinia kristensenii]